jgi:hypothetical protein
VTCEDASVALGQCQEIWAAESFTPIYRVSRVAARGGCGLVKALPAWQSARCSGRVLRVRCNL